MGRQSSRLIYRGKDHKDIYYNGHYHDAMYLSDSKGNVKLLWEKLKGTLVKNVSMMSCVNGKYYAVVESTDYMSQKGFPTLYEGESLNRMHEKGRIFGDESVRGEYYIMYADSNELTVIRTYRNAGNQSIEKHIARIPISENGADMENISYEMPINVYRFSNLSTTFREYFYGNGNNEYYYDGLERAFYKNDNKIKENINRIINVNDKLISTYKIINDVTKPEKYLQFDAFDKNEEFQKHNISLAKVLENASKLFADIYNWDTIEASSIEVSSISRISTGYNDIMMISNTVGYVLISVGLKNDIDIQTYSFLKLYKLKINFNNFSLIEATAIDSNDGYTIYSYMIGNDKYRAQIALKNNEAAISYGLINDDYANDIFIDRFHILDIPNRGNDLLGYKICSLAYSNDILTVRVSLIGSADYGYIVIDTKNKTAKYSEINIYAE